MLLALEFELLPASLWCSALKEPFMKPLKLNLSVQLYRFALLP